MTIEFWPRRRLKPKPPPKPKPPRKRRPRLPIGIGKAQQLLSAAIIMGDHEQASWVDLIVKQGGVIGKPELLAELKKRLDTVMEPLRDSPPPLAASSPSGLTAAGAASVS